MCVRSSTSLDELEIELEGDIYPLNELAAISKKDPKRFVKKSYICLRFYVADKIKVNFIINA